MPGKRVQFDDETWKPKIACRTSRSLPMRIPTKPAMHSNVKPATRSEMKPAMVPI
jgi:hypothetical protein